MSGKDPVQKKKQADDLEERFDAKESEIEAIVAKTHAGMTSRISMTLLKTGCF